VRGGWLGCAAGGAVTGVSCVRALRGVFVSRTVLVFRRMGVLTGSRTARAGAARAIRTAGTPGAFRVRAVSALAGGIRVLGVLGVPGVACRIRVLGVLGVACRVRVLGVPGVDPGRG
jgi:hypothetical protein